MDIPLFVCIRSIFAKDKDAFWWGHFTDEEKELRGMDVWQLATLIQEANVRHGMEQKRIVAEHMLNVRLAKIQSNASWGSGVLGFVGAIVGAALSVSLTNVLQTPCQVPHATQQTIKKQAIAAPVKALQKPLVQPRSQAITHHSSEKPNAAP